MPRKPSAETQLRALRRDLARLHNLHTLSEGAANAYRIRATNAEQEAAEWKRRFDQLLARDNAKERSDEQS